MRGSTVLCVFGNMVTEFGVSILVETEQRIAREHQMRTLYQLGDALAAFARRLGDSHHLRTRHESCSLLRPVTHHGCWRNHEERCKLGVIGALLMLGDRLGKQSEHLHGFAQAHIVGKNPAQPVLPQEREPAETLKLIRSQNCGKTRGRGQVIR